MYRTIYDVQNDSIFAGHTAGLAFLSFAIFWTALWFVIHRYVRGMPEDQRRKGRKGIWVGVFFMIVGCIIVADTTIPAVRDQTRCREWLRAGEFETTTGAVTHFRHEAGKYSPWRFRIGEIDFAYWVINSRKAGFRGDFTTPEESQFKLRDGVPLRISHRDGRILRIEIADTPSKVAKKAAGSE